MGSSRSGPALCASRDSQSPSGRGEASQATTVWSNVNTGEVLPDAATPMTWSIIGRCIPILFGPFLKMLGIDCDRQPLFGLIAGRVYANVSMFQHVLRNVPGMGRAKLRQVFGGLQGAAAPASTARTGVWQRWWFITSRLPALAALFLGRSSSGGASSFLRRFRR